ncbi:MAG: MFS transporter [Parasphingorhabdus sp.]|uniref:MFS transporter n=1 Tax=Parasphingorhabdus sp. TaxID=2709688 RepID=UPI003296BA16
MDKTVSMMDAKPSLWTKLAYGFGSVAYGIKDGGFQYFLLIFYAQVIGLNAQLVGLAILIALVADAISDPIVGYWSDNFRSRWGRRHPFMYAAAIPVAVSYYFLWNPPESWSNAQLFWYVLLLSILIRTFITIYETPSTALAPEMTQDYDERSSVIGFRWFFGWLGGNTMAIAMFILIFPAFVTAAISNGQFNRDAYATYGFIASLIIFGAIMVSALGTHHLIPKLRQPPAKRKITSGLMFREIFETLSSRSFAALFFASLLGFIASGLAGSLNFYFATYFWGFSPEQIGLISLCVTISTFIGLFLAPYITRTIGKKRGAIVIGLIAFTGAPTPILLRLLDILPGNESQFVFWFVLVATTIDVGLIICYQILSASMIADLVEQAELKTGRRSEGIFFAATTFIRKCGIGIGIILASFVLGVVGLESGAGQGEVSQGAIVGLGTVYVPLILALWLTMISVISRYKLDRAGHEENLRQLRAGALSD